MNVRQEIQYALTLQNDTTRSRSFDQDVVRYSHVLSCYTFKMSHFAAYIEYKNDQNFEMIVMIKE